jgi:hypothetical protein
MALYPDAQRRLLDKPKTALTNPEVCCLHTQVGSLYGVDQYFRTVSTFSHFGIGGIWGGDASRNLDGVVYQWGDTRYRSAANLEGNDRVISVETADNAARPIAPWTAKQLTAIVNLLVWVHKTHDIPLVLIPDSKPGRRGVGFHRQGCDPYRVPGGELWSRSFGKDCPTQARIDQIPGLIKRAREIVSGTPTPTPISEDLMSKDLIVVRAPERAWIAYYPKTGLAKLIGANEPSALFAAHTAAEEPAQAINVTTEEHDAFRRYLGRNALTDMDQEEEPTAPAPAEA